MKRSAEVSLFWGEQCIAHQTVRAGESLVDPFGIARPSLVCVHGGDVHVHPADGLAFVLDENERVAVPVGPFTFVIHAGVAEAFPSVPLGKRAEESALPAILGSAAAHLAFFGMLTLLMPTLGPTDTEAIDRDQLDAMAQYLTSAAERETALAVPDSPAEREDGDDAPAHAGRRPTDTAGALANPVPTDAHQQRSVAGHDRWSDGQLSRDRELADAEQFGMVSLLTSATNGRDVGPLAPWGTTLLGADKESHLGNLWGADLGDALGSGLDLSGTGQGVGGQGRGVQQDGLGLNGTGWGGTCDDTCAGGRLGHGSGTGQGASRRRTHAPASAAVRFVDAAVDVEGRLDARIIQRIVRQNQGRFLACYQDALRGNPTLQGRVAVVFVIGREGAVSLARDSAGSDLPDAGARDCIVRRFYDLGFPEPIGGTVHVTYPLLFTPAP